jgi:hypothetical protein
MACFSAGILAVSWNLIPVSASAATRRIASAGRLLSDEALSQLIKSFYSSMSQHGNAEAFAAPQPIDRMAKVFSPLLFRAKGAERPDRQALPEVKTVGFAKPLS